jgi:hypothetical protein
MLLLWGAATLFALPQHCPEAFFALGGLSIMLLAGDLLTHLCLTPRPATYAAATQEREQQFRLRLDEIMQRETHPIQSQRESEASR